MPPSNAAGGRAITAVAVVRGTRGVRGQLWVEFYRDDYPAFSVGQRLFVVSGGSFEEATVEGSFEHKGRCVMKLLGVDGVPEADRLKGMELALPEAEAEPDPPGCFEVGSVKGCEIRDKKRGIIGTAVGTFQGPAYWYIKATGRRGDFEFPAVNGLSVAIDLVARSISVDLPTRWPGLDAEPEMAEAGGAAP